MERVEDVTLSASNADGGNVGGVISSAALSGTFPNRSVPKHTVPLMLRHDATTGAVALACPYCDMEERGGGEDERRIIEDALRGKQEKTN